MTELAVLTVEVEEDRADSAHLLSHVSEGFPQGRGERIPSASHQARGSPTTRVYVRVFGGPAGPPVRVARSDTRRTDEATREGRYSRRHALIRPTITVTVIE